MRVVVLVLSLAVLAGCLVRRRPPVAHVPRAETSGLNSGAPAGGFLKAASCLYRDSDGKAKTCVEIQSRQSEAIEAYEENCRNEAPRTRFAHNVCQSDALFFCRIAQSDQAVRVIYYERKYHNKADAGRVQRDCARKRGRFAMNLFVPR